MKEADFTLIPYGGLGNRINAICSAIVYCRENNKSLRIIWFKDQGLNCAAKDLFSLSQQLINISIKEASFCDYILRDRPRMKNIWIPAFFQAFLYDRRIYEKEAASVFSKKEKADFGPLEKYRHIYMVSYSRLWTSPDMWNYLIPTPGVIEHVDSIISNFGKNTIGIHIRRSDNIVSIGQSPTNLFIQKMNYEIQNDPEVRFYLATDSLSEKKDLIEKFGDRIITSANKTNRNTKEGIIEAYIEMLTLSHTRKIYGSAQSSFSELAHLFSGNEFEIIKTK